jgi:ABC transporter
MRQPGPGRGPAAQPSARSVRSPDPGMAAASAPPSGGNEAGRQAPAAAVEVSHLSKNFGGRAAVEDMSFSVARGEVFGFLGPNGAGKTTTVRILGTLIAPTSGSAVVAGTPLTRANEAEIRQRIPQAFGPVLADRLQETVPGAVRPDDRGQQAVIGEPGQPRGGPRGLGRRPAGEQRRGRIRGERGGEDRDTAQDSPLGLGKQRIAPVQRGAQRPVPVIEPPPAAEQAEPVVEPGLQTVQAQRGQPGGGQFNG